MPSAAFGYDSKFRTLKITVCALCSFPLCFRFLLPGAQLLGSCSLADDCRVMMCSHIAITVMLI